MLPDDVNDVRNYSPNHAFGKTNEFAFYDATTHELLGVVGNANVGQLGHEVTANRNSFRQGLMRHAEVQFGNFYCYEEDESDRSLRRRLQELWKSSCRGRRVQLGGP